MYHLLNFLLVLCVVMIAYGIFQRTFLYLDDNNDYRMVFQLLFKPFLLIFGEMNANESLRNGTTIFDSNKHSEAIEITVAIGFSVFMFVTNLLLINLLIAIFNNIYEDVKNNSDIIWKYERSLMVLEFIHKPPLPIPFNMFYVIWRSALKLRGMF